MKRQVKTNRKKPISLDGISQEALEQVNEKAQAFVDEEKPDKDLYHYGTPRHSGRYPWGSGENPYQGDEMFQRTLKTIHFTKTLNLRKQVNILFNSVT